MSLETRLKTLLNFKHPIIYHKTHWKGLIFKGQSFRIGFPVTQTILPFVGSVQGNNRDLGIEAYHKKVTP